MRCIWLEKQKLSARGVPDPTLPPGEALIRMRLAGICRTDLELVRGYHPYTGVPGHEFVGEVVAAPGDPAWAGKRVVGEINAACGSCPTCKARRPTHCERRSVLGIVNRNGVFAEYLTLPVRNLHEVPPSVPDEAAVFTEPLAAACEILEQVDIDQTDRVLLIGAGRLGQLIAQVLAHAGCILQVAARHPGQRKALLERGIAILRPAGMPERSADLVVEATGSPEGLELARKAVRPRGTIVLKSTYEGKVQVDLSKVVVDEITLVGSRCGPFAPALDLLESGEVDPLPLVEARYPLSDGLRAFEHARRPGSLKVLLYPSG